MNQIKPYPVWVGHAGDGRNFQEIFANSIKAILQLAAEEPPLQMPRELIFCRFPLVDGTGNAPELLQLAIVSAANLLRREMPLLVSCGAGMSRAPAVTAAALATLGGESLEDCLKLVAKHHRTDVSPGFWAEIQQVHTSGAL